VENEINVGLRSVVLANLGSVNIAAILWSTEVLVVFLVLQCADEQVEHVFEVW